ncbi:MAG: sulfite exporter TauE/SafE family protein [Candidatus Hodarchaeota archaeon]
MDPGMFMLIVVIAVGIGALASLFGIGGGFLLVPTMIMILGMSTHDAVGTIPLVIVFMSLSSVIAYGKQKRIDYLVTMIVAVSTVLGSIVGAIFTTFITGQVILVLFGIVEAILALILAFKKTPGEQEAISQANPDPQKWYLLHREHVDADGTVFNYSAKVMLTIPFSFLAGFFSSLLGIGGGTLYIQIYVFICGMTIHMAIACSMATILVSAISSYSTFAIMGAVDYLVAIAYGIGMIIGAQIGARINKKIKSKYLKPLAAAMIIVIAARMIVFALLENPGA